MYLEKNIPLKCYSNYALLMLFQKLFHKRFMQHFQIQSCNHFK